MLHSRGELLLMLDADGATKITDLEKLANQVWTNPIYFHVQFFLWSSKNVIVIQDEFSLPQIHAVAVVKKEGSRDPSIRISDIPITAFGSRAHLEEKALATV